MSSPNVATSVYLDRLARVRAAMAERDIDVVLLSVGHDLPYLTGYDRDAARTTDDARRARATREQPW